MIHQLITGFYFLFFFLNAQYSYAQNDSKPNENNPKNLAEVLKKSRQPTVHVSQNQDELKNHGKSPKPKISVYGLNSLKTFKMEQKFTRNGEMLPIKSSLAIFQIDF